VFIVRGLAIAPAALVLTIVCWFWWFSTRVVGGRFSPLGGLQVGLVMLEAMLVTVAIVLPPALLAGSLAGEKTRNTLGLLLACLVSPREIVAARLAGRLSVVGVILIPFLPALIFLAALLTVPLADLGILLLMPMAVAFGGSGMAVAASAVARRGRDALLAIYLVDLLFLLSPPFSWWLPANVHSWLEPLNPYHGIAALVENDDSSPALLTAGFWSLFGFAGAAWATWRLRPAYLRETEKRVPRRFLFGRGRVPAIREKPMLWKELYVERLRLNRFMRWFGIFIVAVFSGTSLLLAGTYFWGTFLGAHPAEANWAQAQLSVWMRSSSWAIGSLLQWTMGVRAAVAIASERECVTWESLLLSPLEGREIVGAKIYGSLYSLRWFATAIIVAWTAAVFAEALTVEEYVKLLADTLVIGVFMVAAGVCFSLYCSTATRAITLTLVAWMVAGVATTILAWLLVGAVTLAVWMVGVYLAVRSGPGNVFRGGPNLSLLWIGQAVIRLLCFLLAALMITLYCRRNFDRLAGRLFDAPRWPLRRRRRN
jgi:ABC-type transport system involved in multi-copper enzyme maturation permease subunit